MNTYTQLKEVLNDIFELNKADLDFGIYRIMNQKRKQVNEFIDKQLPADIKKALSETQTTDKTQLESELKTLKKNLDDAGIVAEDTPKYKQLTEQLKAAENTDVLEQEVFSHLANFFRRYYKDGDFISMRRYKKDVYAIPYEGEEVKLHWANHDQYYIKSSENFKNYSFTTPDGRKVTFQLKEVSTEQNNNKTQNDAERRFAIYAEQPVEETEGELFINFVYEPFPKATKQESLKLEGYKTILDAISEGFHSLKLPYQDSNGRGRTRKEKVNNKDKEFTVDIIYYHLDSYIAKNSFDYFIHKDLGGFLSRELDFYIKNEVLYLDDINTRQTDFFVAQLSKVKAIKVVAQKVIDFLAQIENFQKKLWLKKKFVVRTDYCITLDRIPNGYYSEIAQNQAQLAEWKRLFDVEIQNEAQLTFEPFLVLDTKFYDEAFKDRLLAEFDNLDEQTNGLLINSENFQALNLMQEKYQGVVKTIYIDPPYSTDGDGFVYKDNFRDSSWCSMLFDRVLLGKILHRIDGGLFTSIDEVEHHNLHNILSDIYGKENYIGDFIWSGGRKNDSKFLSVSHEYMKVFAFDREFLKQNKIEWKQKKKGLEEIYKEHRRLISLHKDDFKLITLELKRWFKNLPDSHPSKAHSHYSTVDNVGIYFPSDISWPGGGGPKYEVLHPVTKLKVKTPNRGWVTNETTLSQWIEDELVHFGDNEDNVPCLKSYLRDREYQAPYSVIYQDGRGATKRVRNILGFDKFGYPKDENVLKETFSLQLYLNDYIIDYFAGSGTTGHATIKLNREDGGNRKYILVEMGTYFNTVTKPRIQKVIYSDNWKNGKPQDKDGISQLVKYQVLESYEDTLNNLYLKPTTELDFSRKAKEEYLLQYMLEMESREHLFNLGMFRNPFSYQLKVTQNNELKPTKVDLVETFNYLIGLYVRKVQRVKDIKVVEGTTRTGINTLVIWRDLDTTTHDEVKKLLRRFYDSQRTREFQQIYINGDHHLENLRTEGDQFKIKMIEETFFKKMFNEAEL